MTQAFSSIPPVLLMEQMGALAEHPVNLGQDAAKSVLLHLGGGRSVPGLCPYTDLAQTGCVAGTIKMDTHSVLIL